MSYQEISNIRGVNQKIGRSNLDEDIPEIRLDFEGGEYFKMTPRFKKFNSRNGKIKKTKFKKKLNFEDSDRTYKISYENIKGLKRV